MVYITLYVQVLGFSIYAQQTIDNFTDVKWLQAYMSGFKHTHHASNSILLLVVFVGQSEVCCVLCTRCVVLGLQPTPLPQRPDGIHFTQIGDIQYSSYLQYNAVSVCVLQSVTECTLSMWSSTSTNVNWSIAIVQLCNCYSLNAPNTPTTQ